MGYVGKPPGAPAALADRNEWYTPAHMINAVREVLGDIELDPMSTPSANQTVGARRIYTKADDALKNRWDARTLFLNPPYSNGTIEPATGYFLSEWRRGVIDEACVLTNDCLDTRWGQRLLSTCAGMCAIAKRIQFIPGFGNDSTQKRQSNSKGQVMYYFGHRLPVFERVFGAHGQCVRRNNFVPEDWAPELTVRQRIVIWSDERGLLHPIGDCFTDFTDDE
jgi:hypothetical protein